MNIAALTTEKEKVMQLSETKNLQFGEASVVMDALTKEVAALTTEVQTAKQALIAAETAATQAKVLTVTAQTESAATVAAMDALKKLTAEQSKTQTVRFDELKAMTENNKQLQVFRALPPLIFCSQSHS